MYFIYFTRIKFKTQLQNHLRFQFIDDISSSVEFLMPYSLYLELCMLTMVILMVEQEDAKKLVKLKWGGGIPS